jgi:hypothetical protein
MKRITLEKSLEFWDFAANPQFTGKFIETIVVNDEETEEEKKVTAHIFEEMETGEEYYISDSFMITRSIRRMKDKYKINHGILEINFKGKDSVKGKPLNRFEIILLEEDEKKKDKKSGDN